MQLEPRHPLYAKLLDEFVGFIESLKDDDLFTKGFTRPEVRIHYKNLFWCYADRVLSVSPGNVGMNSPTTVLLLDPVDLDQIDLAIEDKIATCEHERQVAREKHEAKIKAYREARDQEFVEQLLSLFGVKHAT